MDHMYYAEATGKELDQIVGKIQDVLEGENSNTIMMACLAIAIAIQDPTITQSSLQKGIMGASEWIALFTTNSATPGQVN